VSLPALARKDGPIYASAIASNPQSELPIVVPDFDLDMPHLGMLKRVAERLGDIS